jgi:hypothetical protein
MRRIILQGFGKAAVEFFDAAGRGKAFEGEE